MNENEHRKRFKVLIGGAHPEGKLTKAQTREFRERASRIISREAHRKRAETIQHMYLEHCADVDEECAEYARIMTALQLGKHITFVGHQDEILAGQREGEVDKEVARVLYISFMRILSSTIRRWGEFYEVDEREDFKLS